MGTPTGGRLVLAAGPWGGDPSSSPSASVSLPVEWDDLHPHKVGVSLQAAPVRAPAQVGAWTQWLLNPRSPEHPQVGPQGRDNGLPLPTLWDPETLWP